MNLFVAFLVTAGLLVGADPTPEELDKKDQQGLQGGWASQSFELGGMKPEGAQSIRIVIKDDEMTFKNGEQVLVVVKYKVGAGFTPKLIDLTFTQGQPKGQTFEGIYTLDGDEFKLCLVLMEKERPTEFVSPQGSNTALIVFKRESP